MGILVVILAVVLIFLFFSYSNINKEEMRKDLSGSNRMKYPIYAKYLENFVMILGTRKSMFKLIYDKDSSLVYEIDLYDKENVYVGKLTLALKDEKELYICGTYRHFYGLKFTDREIDSRIIKEYEINNQDYIAVLILSIMDNVDAIRISFILMGYI